MRIFVWRGWKLLPYRTRTNYKRTSALEPLRFRYMITQCASFSMLPRDTNGGGISIVAALRFVFVRAGVRGDLEGYTLGRLIHCKVYNNKEKRELG